MACLALIDPYLWSCLFAYRPVCLCVCVCVRAHLWKGCEKQSVRIVYPYCPRITSLSLDSEISPKINLVHNGVFWENSLSKALPLFDMLNFSSCHTWQSTADYVKENLISRQTCVYNVFGIPPGSWKTMNGNMYDHDLDWTTPFLWRHCGEQYTMKPRGYMSVTRGHSALSNIQVGSAKETEG